MSEGQVTTKAELLHEIERAWAAFTAALDRWPETQLTTVRDPQGWTAKDHLIHLTYWERSAMFFLAGQPRHAALGVDEELYLKGSDDEINAVIFQEHQAVSWSEAVAQFRAVQQQLMSVLQPLTDADLQKRYRAYLPDEPAEGDGPLAINVVYGNSAGHFAEHLAWIEELLTRAAVS
jgi:hypothetical protein